MGVKQERESRIRLCGALRFWGEKPEDGGAGAWNDVSRAGASIQLGRYLRPGRNVWMEFESPLSADAPMRARARVVWCTPQGGNRFVAGLAIYRDCPKSALDFSALGYFARRQMNAGSGSRVVTPSWNLFPRREAEEVIGLAHAQAV